LKYNIFFTFRHCAFRDKRHLRIFSEQPFQELFDLKLFDKYELYVPYDTIKPKLTPENCYNLNDKKLSHSFLNKKDILNELINLNKEYVVLKQFWLVNKFQDLIDYQIHINILPCNHLMQKYIEIKDNLIKDEPYNYIHYRYEKDFTHNFKCKIEPLIILIERIKFKNNNLKIYIATSNIKSLLDLNNSRYKNLIYKNDDILMNLNFEQRAFIDYMFGLESQECYGHKNSSFSCMINNIKKTNNYYAGC
jgi:hypothetical protein